MEAAKSLFCSSPPFPLRTNNWSGHPSSSSTSGTTKLPLSTSCIPLFSFCNFKKAGLGWVSRVSFRLLRKLPKNGIFNLFIYVAYFSTS